MFQQQHFNLLVCRYKRLQYDLYLAKRRISHGLRLRPYGQKTASSSSPPIYPKHVIVICPPVHTHNLCDVIILITNLNIILTETMFYVLKHTVA